VIIKEIEEPVKHSYFVPLFSYPVTLCADNGDVSERWDGVGLKRAAMSVPLLHSHLPVQRHTLLAALRGQVCLSLGSDTSEGLSSGSDTGNCSPLPQRQPTRGERGWHNAHNLAQRREEFSSYASLSFAEVAPVQFSKLV